MVLGILLKLGKGLKQGTLSLILESSDYNKSIRMEPKFTGLNLLQSNYKSESSRLETRSLLGRGRRRRRRRRGSMNE